MSDHDERDYHQEHKDDLAQGITNEDGSVRDQEPPENEEPDQAIEAVERMLADLRSLQRYARDQNVDGRYGYHPLATALTVAAPALQALEVAVRLTSSGTDWTQTYSPEDPWAPQS